MARARVHRNWRQIVSDRLGQSGRNEIQSQQEVIRRVHPFYNSYTVH
ncbi:hypothetical protein FPSE_01806 [Fusarium pseudograminearum CS3096]|uniref:Uncharacterized protein n=1 Tax=Fusarium pseudograminearum (strain CS3096) TaxID=1028729 RepID=K3VUR4_FUSPC|nr:hypothetical protein FPSE_01806 [Fusarium pseudograminearum CS3096]EKJ78018.1 hypothetical protein FPSE_01806 [Fusarium pseudograminearum CS3096]